MAVAEPVFTMYEESDYTEVHVVITTIEHWQFSAIQGDGWFEDFVCHSQCCNLGNTATGSNTHAAPANFELGSDLLDSNGDDDFINESQIQTDYSEDAEEESVESNVVRTVAVADAAETIPGTTTTAPPRPSFSSIKKLAAFINYIKGEISSVNGLTTPNPFKPIEPPSCQQSSNSQTPVKDHTSELGKKRKLYQDGPFDYMRPDENDFQFTIKKTRSIESEIYLKSFKCTYLFPQLIDITKEDEEGMVTFTFEKMYPIIDREKMVKNDTSGTYYDNEKLPLGPFIRDDSVKSLLLDTTLFAVHILYGLYILHEDIGVVHSDISPNNIMFSPLNNIWKLNDFESVYEINLTLKTVRNVGTRGFIAPESIATGIYTEKSDVYSLGETIRCTFLANLFKEFGKAFGGNLARIRQLQSLLDGMVREDPNNRLNVQDALSQAYALLEDLLKSGAYKSYDIYGKHNLIPEVKRLLASINEKDEIPLKPIM